MNCIRNRCGLCAFISFRRNSFCHKRDTERCSAVFNDRRLRIELIILTFRIAAVKHGNRKRLIAADPVSLLVIRLYFPFIDVAFTVLNHMDAVCIRRKSYDIVRISVIIGTQVIRLYTGVEIPVLRNFHIVSDIND